MARDAVPHDRAGSAVSAASIRKRVQLLGTGLWDDPRIFSDRRAAGRLVCRRPIRGLRSFAARYRARYGSEPVRTATLAYDAITLVAALVKTQGPQRFTDEVLTNPSGFTGIDGVFRFRRMAPMSAGLR